MSLSTGILVCTGEKFLLFPYNQFIGTFSLPYKNELVMPFALTLFMALLTTSPQKCLTCTKSWITTTIDRPHPYNQRTFYSTINTIFQSVHYPYKSPALSKYTFPILQLPLINISPLNNRTASFIFINKIPNTIVINNILRINIVVIILSHSLPPKALPIIIITRGRLRITHK